MTATMQNYRKGATCGPALGSPVKHRNIFTQSAHSRLRIAKMILSSTVDEALDAPLFFGGMATLDL